MIRDILLNRWAWAIVFGIEVILYIVWVIPKSIQTDKIKKQMKEADARFFKSIEEAEQIIENEKEK